MSAIVKIHPVRWSTLISKEDWEKHLNGETVSLPVIELISIPTPIILPPPKKTLVSMAHPGRGNLRGQASSVKDDEWGMMCENHPDIPAVIRLCSESDSFGSEYYNLCAPCNTRRVLQRQRIIDNPELWTEHCPDCGRISPELFAYRDPDEGHNGPVYEQCKNCCKVRLERAEREYEAEFGHEDDDYPEPDFDSFDCGMDEDEQDDLAASCLNHFVKLFNYLEKVISQYPAHVEMESVYEHHHPPYNTERVINEVLDELISFPLTVDAEEYGINFTDYYTHPLHPQFYYSEELTETKRIFYFTLPDVKYHIFAIRGEAVLQWSNSLAGLINPQQEMVIVTLPGIFEYRFDPVRHKIKGQTNHYSSYQFAKRLGFGKEVSPRHTLLKDLNHAQ